MQDYESIFHKIARTPSLREQNCAKYYGREDFIYALAN